MPPRDRAVLYPSERILPDESSGLVEIDRVLEEFWIIDVDGTRLVIDANWSPASPPGDMAEMRAILGSIRIEP